MKITLDIDYDSGDENPFFELQSAKDFYSLSLTAYDEKEADKERDQVQMWLNLKEVKAFRNCLDLFITQLKDFPEE